MKRFVLLAGATLLLAIPAGGAADEASPLRVAYVTDLGTPTDRGVGQAEYAGFVRAVKRFGLESRVVQVPPRGSWDDALASFARQRYDLVVAGPFIPAQVVVKVARRFPRVKFLTLLPAFGVVRHPPQNVREFDFRVEEAAFAAGYLRGRRERQGPGADVVSAVGGAPPAPVLRFIAGYKAGARAADPGITVLVGYSQNFADPAKCRPLASAQAARG